LCICLLGTIVAYTHCLFLTFDLAKIYYAFWSFVMVWRTLWTFHNFILFLYGIVCQRSNVRTIVDYCFKYVFPMCNYVHKSATSCIEIQITYPIPDRWRMCTISYSIPRWRTAISCGQCRSSNMIYYAEMHRQTVEKLTWLKGTYYTENPSIRFMFVTFQYYCICWMSKLPRLKIKHHENYDDRSVWMCFRDRIQRQNQENLPYLCYPL
jgi:hypothetical protein